jgi:hypothetical protein
MTDSFNFYVDSRDGEVVGNSPADILFINVLGQNIASDHYAISLEQCIIPNLEYPINTKNNTFQFEEGGGGGVVTATLDPGNYTGATLATQIKTQMEAVSPNTYTYTASYLSDQSKMNIQTTLPDTFKILSDNETLGFTVQSSFVSGFTGDNPIRLDGSTYYDITSNLQTLNMSTSGRTNVLARIHNLVNYGGLNFFENQNSADSTQISGGSMDRFEIRIVDDKGQLVEFPSTAHWSAMFRMTRVS